MLLGAGLFEAGEVEVDACVAGRVHHEVEGEAVGFVEMEGVRTRNTKPSSIELVPCF